MPVKVRSWPHCLAGIDCFRHTLVSASDINRWWGRFNFVGVRAILYKSSCFVSCCAMKVHEIRVKPGRAGLDQNKSLLSDAQLLESAP